VQAFSGGAGGFFDDTSDEADGSEADHECREAAGEVGNDDAAALREGGNSLPGDIGRGLNTAAPEDAAVSDIEELAVGGAGTERGDLDAVPGDLCGEAESKEAVEDFGGGVGGDVGDGLKAGRGGQNEDPSAGRRGGRDARRLRS